MDITPGPAASVQAPLPPQVEIKRKVCPQCHQPVLPEYYFCPNCGKKLDDRPLSTSIGAQIWLYFFTLIIMPLTCYLVYTRWQGIKYFRSDDPKARQMGLIAIVLLVVSIVFLIWSTWASIAWFQQYVQSQESSVNNLGGLGGL